MFRFFLLLLILDKRNIINKQRSNDKIFEYNLIDNFLSLYKESYFKAKKNNINKITVNKRFP